MSNCSNVVGPTRTVAPAAGEADATLEVDVAIVGAGFGGLGMAVRLEQAGRHDYVVLERSDDVGGTWHDNTYPGAQCDVPSHLYSFSFAPNPDWSRTYSHQQEIWDYLRRVAKDTGIGARIRTSSEVRSATWDAGRGRWLVRTAGGDVSARVLVSATGALSEPLVPDLDGLASFRGPAFHSAHWDHGVELAGRRVAVIGTGASAIQFVPVIAPDVAHLDVFQRTPPWVVPHHDRPVSGLERALYRRLPAAQKAVRAWVYALRELLVPLLHDPRRMRGPQGVALRHLRRQVADPELRAKLRPHYAMGCKRILLSSDWYPALTRRNVSVVTEAVTAVTPDGVVTADGTEHAADVIVFATGFHVTDMPFADRVAGDGGVTLAEAWRDGMEAYLGTTVAGFPNLFMLVGPNTGLGHNSMIFMIESQIAYVLGALATMDAAGATSVEVRRAVQDGYNDGLQRRLARTVWNSGGCRSWYLDARGRNTTLWPGFTFEFRRRTRRFDPADYVLLGRGTG